MIKVGLVGLGSIMRGVHIPGIRLSADYEIVALCDVKRDVLDQQGVALGVPPERRFTDYRELVALADVDAVDIATPNDVHAEIAIAALRAGKKVSCEKPLALNAADAAKVALVADETGLANAVCFSYRFKAAARFARDIVRGGDLGKIHHVSIQYMQGWGLESVGCPLVWRFVKSVTGSGALGDLGSHAVDLVTFVTGQSCRRVVAHCGTEVHERVLPGDKTQKGPVDVDDYANFMAELDGGASACFQITRLAIGRGNYQRMEIYGAKGGLVYSLDDNGSGKDTLRVCLGEAMRRKGLYQEIEIPPCYKVSQMQCVADVFNGRGDGLVATLADGSANMKVMDAVVKSAEDGTWVDCL